MSTKNLSRSETNYLRKGELNSLIREFYQVVISQKSLPQDLKPHWDLLKGLLISSKTMTSESTDELISYILALGDISSHYDNADTV